MKKARNLIDSKRKSRKSVAIKLGHDRISSLTDSVLCNILSFLPTDNAVGTSILSSRWRHVWTSLHTLLFDATVCIRQGDFTDVTMERFEMFVISVVLRTEPSNVQKFSLHSYRVSGSSRLKEWVSSAVMRDVRELELNIENQQRLELPESIYSCRSLQVLKLDSDFDIAVPGSGICFPNVKFLRVSLQYPENKLTEKLFSSCPSIEELWLKVLLETILVDDYNFAFNNCEHKGFIMAPLIEILHVVDDLMVSYEVHDLQFLQTVNVGFFFPDWSVLNPWESVQLVNAVLNCKNLTLSSGVMLALERANLSVLPSVPQLTHFEVHIGETGWRALPLILTSAPLLEKFVLVKECWVNACDPKFGWMENGCVPQCLAQHVKEIEIQGVEDVEDDVKLLEFFMKHCLVLQTMIIRCKRTVTNKKVNHLLRTV
ncbi:putative FBD-associated F-box protein [Citrus sinensis]|uniref:FBD-associated F-box protein n=1 Tax=Citrus sinensis TaxID=2711 RepID=A0ACB8NZG2_CITSI|nr:putative FBD-associated F-box protein [Citrus sinensis]